MFSPFFSMNCAIGTCICTKLPDVILNGCLLSENSHEIYQHKIQKYNTISVWYHQFHCKYKCECCWKACDSFYFSSANGNQAIKTCNIQIILESISCNWPGAAGILQTISIFVFRKYDLFSYNNEIRCTCKVFEYNFTLQKNITSTCNTKKSVCKFRHTIVKIQVIKTVSY